MKEKISVLLGLTLFAINIIVAQEFETQMEVIFTSEIESARLQHIKSAIDSKGKIHLVFTGYENHPYYGTNSTGKWQFNKLEYIDTEYNETYNVAYFPNIALDKNDNINIVMFDRYKEKILHSKKAIGAGEWSFNKIQISPEPKRFEAYGEYTDMAIDKKGGLHFVCMADYTNLNEHKSNMSAIYLNKPFDSEKWQLQLLVQTNDEQYNNSWFFGNNSSIACYDDKVFVAIGGSNELHFGTRNITGGYWNIEKLLTTPDKFINSEKNMLSLAVSPNGSLKFAFFDRTDDENSPYHGLTVFSQSSCGKKGWRGFNGFDEPLSMNRPCIAIDNNGKTYLSIGRKEFALFHQVCDCNSEYKEIFSNSQKSGDFVDMVIDAQNAVHVFYTSNDDNQLYNLTAIPKSSTKDCNYPPIVTDYTGKTNLAPGEKWTGTIKASDPECDNIKFYSIRKPDYFTINDHGNGTATIHATIPEGDGFGETGITVFIQDDKHENVDNKLSAITFLLKVSQDGKDKGSIKVKNKCTGSLY